MLTKFQATKMLELQATANDEVNSAWLTMGHLWFRSALAGDVQRMETHGWKWWRDGRRETRQISAEIVDIWQFILSHVLIEANGDFAEAAERLVKDAPAALTITVGIRGFDLTEMNSVRKLDLLIGMSLLGETSVAMFASILDDCEMTWNALFRRYTSRYVLNAFRRDSGSHFGTYRTFWAGRQDHEHATELAAQGDTSCSRFMFDLYVELAKRYRDTAPCAIEVA